MSEIAAWPKVHGVEMESVGAAHVAESMKRPLEGIRFSSYDPVRGRACSAHVAAAAEEVSPEAA